jgi:hypothetical protein
MSLYALSAASTAAAAIEGGTVVGFKAGEGRMEHFPAWNDDDIEACGHLLAPEYLPRQALGAVPNDCGPEFPGCSHTEPQHGAAVRQYHQIHEPPAHPHSLAVDTFEIGSASDALDSRQRVA